MSSKIVFLKSIEQTNNYVEKLNAFLVSLYKSKVEDVSEIKTFPSTEEMEEFSKAHCFKFPLVVLDYNSAWPYQKCYVLRMEKPKNVNPNSFLQCKNWYLSFAEVIEIPTLYLEIFDIQKAISSTKDKKELEELNKLQEEVEYITLRFRKIWGIYRNYYLTITKANKKLSSSAEYEFYREKIDFQQVRTFNFEIAPAYIFFSERTKEENKNKEQQKCMLLKLREEKKEIFEFLKSKIAQEIKTIKSKIENPVVQEQVFESVKKWRNQMFKDLRKQINDEIKVLKEGIVYSTEMLECLDLNDMYWSWKEHEEESGDDEVEEEEEN